MKNKDLKIEYRQVTKLRPYTKNARVHPPEQIDKIKRLIETVGFVVPILVDGKNGILKGHGSLQAALQLGMQRVPVIELSGLSQGERQAYILADNRVALDAGWDQKLLTIELGDLKKMGVDLSLTGFSMGEIKQLMVGMAGVKDPDEVPPVPAKPVSRLGDLWVMGAHRLLCGDATKAEDVARLMGGAKAAMVFADPPYGMNLNPDYDAMHSSPAHRKTGKRFAAVLGDDAPFDPRPAMALTGGAVEQFWWGADYYRANLPSGGSWVVWDKRANESGMNLDAVIGGAFELCWSQQAHRREIARILWSGHHGMQGEDAKKRLHPTQKPTALVQFFLERWPASGAIYDPFVGSGTTLIASEMTGRACCALEIAPQYVDVSIRRWQEFTGKEATHATEKKTFDALTKSRGKGKATRQ